MIASYRLNFAKLVTKRERSLFVITYLDKKCNSVQQFCAIFIHYLDKLQTIFSYEKQGWVCRVYLNFHSQFDKKDIYFKIKDNETLQVWCETINISNTITYVLTLLLAIYNINPLFIHFILARAKWCFCRFVHFGDGESNRASCYKIW